MHLTLLESSLLVEEHEAVFNICMKWWKIVQTLTQYPSVPTRKIILQTAVAAEIRNKNPSAARQLMFNATMR